LDLDTLGPHPVLVRQWHSIQLCAASSNNPEELVWWRAKRPAQLKHISRRRRRK